MAKRTKSARPAKKRSPRWSKDYAINRLPFVGPFPHGDPKGSTFPRCFWANVRCTGDLEQDQRLGEQYAHMDAMVADGFPPLLFWILEDMHRQNCSEHIKIGFVHAFAEAALDAVRACKTGGADGQA